MIKKPCLKKVSVIKSTLPAKIPKKVIIIKSKL